MSVSLNDVAEGLSNESVSLVDFAEEPGGAWSNGWYKAKTIEGFATAKSNKQYNTEDSVSGKGDSRNLRICLTVTRANGDERTLQDTLNYRSGDFTSERLAYIKQAREDNKGERHWNDKDAQRSSLAIASIGQLQKALGFEQLKLANGGIVAGAFIGQDLDVRLGADENGFNVVTAFAPAGTKTGGKRA